MEFTRGYSLDARVGKLNLFLSTEWFTRQRLRKLYSLMKVNLKVLRFDLCAKKESTRAKNSVKMEDFLDSI